MSNHPIRSFVRAKIAGYFPEKPEVADNIEKSLYNSTIRNGKKNGMILNWNNPKFKHSYKQRWICLNTNLSSPKNEILRSDILSGKLKNLKEIAYLPPEKLWPNGPHSQMKLKIKQKQAAKDASNDRLGEDYQGMFECSKCRRMGASNTRKTTYYQLQTRSADEPMTTFVSCHGCGNRWKF